MPASIVRDFVYAYDDSGKTVTLTAPVIIPLQHPVSELAQRLLQAHNLPCFTEKGLIDELTRFVDHQGALLADENGDAALSRLRDSDVNVDALVDGWTTAFKQDVSSFAARLRVTNERVFSDVYHALIHSPALQTLLTFEHAYASAVEHVTRQRDDELALLEIRQREEMETAVQHLGVVYTDDQINQLAHQHFDNRQMLESKWASELSSTQDGQKREYKQWVMQMHADSQTDRQAVAPPVYAHNGMPLEPPSDESRNSEEESARREESFTVHLGAQLKTMHNLRLISADVLDLCRYRSSNIEGLSQPQRLQTAMSLYSNSLCALVLLVDNRLNSYTGAKRDFAHVCEQATDFHFADLERQFEAIEVNVAAATASSAGRDEDVLSQHSSGSGVSEREDCGAVALRSGDFYVTRHSNLAEVHVVFHLVVDDAVRSTTCDVTSRHPVVLGYRNILKMCFRFSVHTITLPLLLYHEMVEEMTIAWCLKRAELIFKCVKGFTMELDTWSAQQATTVQFLLPKDLSDETFSAINSMLPSIFRMSNPVVGKSS